MRVRGGREAVPAVDKPRERSDRRDRSEAVNPRRGSRSRSRGPHGARRRHGEKYSVPVKD